MLSTIRTYRNLRARGLTQAWEIAGMPDVLDKLVGWALSIIGIICAAYLLTDYANAAQQADKQYIAALERTLAACLSDDVTGKPIKIGDDWYLCGIVHYGTWK